MSLTNCPSCRHWIYTGWGNGMCNLGIGYCRYEMKGDLDGDSLYPSLPITEWTRYVPNPAEEFKKLNERIKNLTIQVKELTESMKEFNKHLPVSEDKKEYEQVLNSMRAEKEFAENVLPHAGVGYLGDKEEPDGN